jgi:biotin carboxyl carrier protein
MKMENEVKAKGPGTVQTVHVSVGATVEANAKLVTFG